MFGRINGEHTRRYEFNTETDCDDCFDHAYNI
jgi:hypothetical protein